MLNKSDLVPPERLKELEGMLGEIKTDARFLHSVKGDVPLPLLLSVGQRSAVEAEGHRL